MQAVNRIIVDKFANAFAEKKVGFSAKEITDYFCSYSNYVKPHDHYGINLKRKDLFIESVYQLRPKEQYYSLNDLAFFIKDSKYDYPNKEIRLKLLEDLHTSISPDPIGLRISELRETAYREKWMVALSRIGTEPSAAITAGRTMLETVLKTIITERRYVAKTNGDVGELLKQAQDILDFNKGKRQGEHQILKGLASVVSGICNISNDAGDRHGIIMGKSINDPFIAQLVINSAGVIAIALIELHLLTSLDNVKDSE